MTAKKAKAAGATAAAKTDRETCLVSATGLGDFIDFVRERVVNGASIPNNDLADIWRKAYTQFEKIKAAEPGIADKPPVLPLTRRMQSHFDKLVQLPSFNSTFTSVPVAFGLVELDKLVVYQQFVTRSSIDFMTSSIRQPVTPAALLKLCLPLTPPDTSFRLARQDGNQFAFISDNHDGRFLGAQLLDPSQITGMTVHGHPAKVVALPFGFTTNALNVVRFGNRMVLNNGYHRALALRSMGITHAPCIIQVCSHWDDVAIAGASAIYNDGETYFSHPRPPILRDYFNKKLTKTFNTYHLRKEIRLTFEVSTLKLSV